MTDQPLAGYLPTEARNPRTLALDEVATLELLTIINREDVMVADAVAACLPVLAEVVDAAAARLRAGGRILYFGAGTSGRLAVLDAAELEPTFSLEPGRVVAYQAGGAEALTSAIEGAEDHAEEGAAAATAVAAQDLVIGLTASGRTPYVRGALETAAEAGAATALVSSNPRAPIAPIVDWHVCADTGPEVVAGSTRMKAGTAQKLVLNAFSTAVMVRLGKTYSNLMVDVHATNDKLQTRTLTILREATGADDHACRRALGDAGDELKTALVMLHSGLEPALARAALARHDGNVRRALREVAPASRLGVPVDGSTTRPVAGGSDTDDAVGVRWATAADGNAIAGVMCRALKAAYLGTAYVVGTDGQPPGGSVVPEARRRLAELTADELLDGARAMLEVPDQTDRTLVAIVDGAVVGFHRLRLDVDQAAGRLRGSSGGAGDASGSTRGQALLTGEVASLYVDPAAWRSGSGARLLEVGLAQLASDGCRQAWLWVADENDRAQRFYRRRGFAPDGTTRSYRMQPWGVDLGFDLTLVRLVCDLQSSEPDAQAGASAVRGAGEHDDPPSPPLGGVGSTGSFQ